MFQEALRKEVINRKQRPEAAGMMIPAENRRRTPASGQQGRKAHNRPLQEVVAIQTGNRSIPVPIPGNQRREAALPALTVQEKGVQILPAEQILPIGRDKIINILYICSRTRLYKV
jgi:hypothetical protein